MADQTLAKFVNELSILTLLRTRGPASRAEIARRLLLTPATITRLIGSLAARGLVREADDARAAGSREPGRPGVRVAINAEGAYFLGVEVGFEAVRFALLDLAAGVVASSEMRIAPTDFTPPAAVDLIARHFGRLARNRRLKGRILGLGVTLPALLDREGRILNLPILGWEGLDFRERLEGRIDIPIYMENDAHAAAFGAVYTQPTMASVCTLFLRIGTGVGGAAIINSRLFRGAHGTAGLFGHFGGYDSRGPRCRCGRRGCFEPYVNTEALARYFHGEEVPAADLDLLPALVAAEAAAGNRRAISAIARLERFLGEGLVSLVNVFNPSVVVLGGAMLPVLGPCLDGLFRAIASGVFAGVEAPELVLSHLGDFDSAIGAATIAHHNTFDLSRFTLLEPELHP